MSRSKYGRQAAMAADWKHRARKVSANVAGEQKLGDGAVFVTTPRDYDSGELQPEKLLIAIELAGVETVVAAVDAEELQTAVMGKPV